MASLAWTLVMEGHVSSSYPNCHGGPVCPGVMPPDEYHSGVNNSVYTNVLVQNRSDIEHPLP